MPTLDSILMCPNTVREIGPRLYSALPDTAIGAPYDKRVFVYDAVVGKSIYHQVFWGTTGAAYDQFARVALKAAGSGCFAELGCGSLLFTTQMYRDFQGPLALLVDRSLGMLRRAVKRLSPAGRPQREGVVFLHSDCAALPLRENTFSSILSLNVFHVPCDGVGIASECARLLVPGVGKLFVSSLVRSGRWSDSYMALLHRMGELAAPMTRDELCAKVAGQWGVVESSKMEGNMCYLVVRHAG